MLLNGQSEDRITIADRGLQYGDGLFETLAVVAGQPCLWKRHMRRLRRGCDRLEIPFPDPDLLLEEVSREIGRRQRGVIKIILTRGAGGRGYRPPQETAPNRIILSYPWPDYPEYAWNRGVRVRICTTRLGINPALAGLKSLNRLEQVLARSEWSADNIAEGLMLDPGDRLIEGTMSNLFVLREGNLFTPDLSRCGTAGVMRELIIDTAQKQDIPVVITDLPLHTLSSTEGLFLCNSLIGIWPVSALPDRELDPGVIDAGLVDEVTEQGFIH